MRYNCVTIYRNRCFERYNCVKANRDIRRRGITVSQSIEMAVGIDITVSQPIEIALRVI